MPYSLARKIPPDGARVDLMSHWDVSLVSGRILPPSFVGPVLFDLDLDDGQRMPTFFTTPGFLAREGFARSLQDAGVDNIDVYPAIIRNPETGEPLADYQFINIVGLVSCADMNASTSASLGPGINVIDEIVLQADKIPSHKIFRLAEDPIRIIISDDLRDFIVSLGLDDLYIEELKTA